jgi:CHAD domain-containing protein
LRWLGELLGRVRDADVLLAGLSERAADLPSEERQAANRLIAELHEMRARDHAALVEAMNTSRYVTLLERLVVAARRPELRAGASDTRVTKLAARLTRRPQKRLQRSIERLDADDPADRDLHEVRKRAKQVRYALESVAPVTGKKAKCTANRVAALQDLLGEHQDAVVAAAWLREAALDSAEPMVAFAAGRLAGAYDGQRRARRRAWRDAWDATGLA